MTGKAKWYVVHTYSGYENKVKANLEKAIENRNLEEFVHDIQVPMEEQIEIKDGKKKVTFKKVFPGYVMVKMVMTDDSWYIVRNTRGVTGFVGPGSKPVPLTDEEVNNMGIKETYIHVDFAVGDLIKVTSGPFEKFEVLITEVNIEKHKVKGLVNMFGRETSVELDFNQIEKIN